MSVATPTFPLAASGSFLEPNAQRGRPSGRATSPITRITGGWGHPQRLVQSSVRGPGLRALMCRSRAGFGCFSTRDYALRDQWSDVPHFAGTAARRALAGLSEVCDRRFGDNGVAVISCKRSRYTGVGDGSELR